uniref:Uncharacterized protein n=1 Tax=Rhipicephalus pulchellus TaxID=72859 RepID=L7LZ12_RHIPC
MCVFHCRQLCLLLYMKCHVFFSFFLLQIYICRGLIFKSCVLLEVSCMCKCQSMCLYKAALNAEKNLCVKRDASCI